MSKSSNIRKSELTIRSLRDGKIALGICIGFLGFVGGYLTLDLLDQGLTRTETISVLPPLLALLVATTSLIVAFNALHEQKRMRQAGTDPVIMVHIATRADEPVMVNLAISNVGAGAAVDIDVDIIAPPEMNGKKIISNIFGTHHRIRVILQNQSINYPMNVGWELLEDPPLPAFKATVSYSDIEGSRYTAEHIIDVLELGSRAAHSPPETRTARATEKIVDALRELSVRLSNIHAVAETKADYDVDQQADRVRIAKALREQIEKKGK